MLKMMLKKGYDFTFLRVCFYAKKPTVQKMLQLQSKYFSLKAWRSFTHTKVYLLAFKVV